MQSDRDTLVAAFSMLTADERQLLVCALAGNHPDRLAPLRMDVLRGLARADREAVSSSDDQHVRKLDQENAELRRQLRGAVSALEAIDREARVIALNDEDAQARHQRIADLAHDALATLGGR